MKKQFKVVALSLGVVFATPAVAQEALNFDAYREMLADGNPAELYEMEGEELWRTARGSKNATLEQCDLGLGAGVVKGATALPEVARVFARSGVRFIATSRMDQLRSMRSAGIWLSCASGKVSVTPSFGEPGSKW